MPDLISLPRQVVSRGHPVLSWIALKLHFVPRLRGNDSFKVFNSGVINFGIITR